MVMGEKYSSAFYYTYMWTIIIILNHLHLTSGVLWLIQQNVGSTLIIVHSKEHAIHNIYKVKHTNVSKQVF